ncbi:DAK2 domain-containing protein, partial [Actinotalea ferrariae]|uniref:DAK2 domain-containing protein n=1 Tax=Actinotalea ferrariae TaxID=1386098 RepID=UPI001C8CD64A
MGTTVTVDAALLRRWSAGAVAALQRASGRLDADNVFPVPDGDTGTNLLLTVAEAADSLTALVTAASSAEGEDAAVAGGPVPVRLAAQALMRGALVGARGSSGVIVSQYLRGLLGSLDVAPGAGSATLDAAAVARALREAADAAYGAVGEPVEGTVLT